MAATIPADVLDSIIDFLASEDDRTFSSVKACSLVSHKFLARARSHIFKYIVIRSLDSSGPTPLMFTRLISQNSEIAHYVISLEYSPKLEDADLVTESFATALSSLKRLKRLVIQPFHILWKDLPFKEAIVNLMHLPALSHFEFNDGRGFHVSDLALCTGLKSFKTTGAEADRGGGDVKIYPEKPPLLESYVGGPVDNGDPSQSILMQLCTTLRADGKPVIDITGLKRISLGVVFNELDAIARCFKLCTQLTDIRLSKFHNLLGNIAFETLFLPSLQTLRHIRLDFVVFADKDPFPPLISGFASLRGNNIIQSIRISILFLDCDCDDDEWGALDRVFTPSESGWGSLRFFSLHLKVGRNAYLNSTGVDDKVQHLRKLPETQLRDLGQNTDIAFDFDVSARLFYY